MKIIGLLIVKNESWILPTTLPQQLRFVDELLVLDGNSTDNTRQILKSAGKKVHIRIQQKNNDNYAAWRQELLDWARQRNATHIVAIDGDETFSSDVLLHWHKTLLDMKPGQKLFFNWISLWKSPVKYLSEGGVFAKLTKDFVFCDDKISPYASIALHEGRTPGVTKKSNSIYIPKNKGVVLHFQFVPWERLQMKQAYIRCKDFRLNTDTAKAINYKYEITLENGHEKTEPVDKKWIKGLKLKLNLKDMHHDYFYGEILKYFEERGIEFYENLNLWHIKKLHTLFITTCNREPKIKEYNSATKFLRRTIGKIVNSLPDNYSSIITNVIKKITRTIGL